MSKMYIHIQPKVDGVVAKVSSNGGVGSSVWWRCCDDATQDVASKCDTVMIGLLPLYISCEKLVVTIEESNSCNINFSKERFQQLLKLIGYWFRVEPLSVFNIMGIEFSPDSKIRDDVESVAFGMSMGVDSIASYELMKNYKLFFTLFNVGAFGEFSDSRTLHKWERASTSLKKVSCDFDTPILRVDSNLSDIYTKHSIGFQRSHILRNVSCSYLYSDRYEVYGYSSTYPYKDLWKGFDDISYIEPVLIPLLSTALVQIKNVGEGLSRLEKMELIKDSILIEYLDICVNPNRHNLEKINCGRCWKCSRAKLNLAILNRHDILDKIFVNPVCGLRDKTVVRASKMYGRPADVDLLRALNLERSISIALLAIPTFIFWKMKDALKQWL